MAAVVISDTVPLSTIDNAVFSSALHRKRMVCIFKSGNIYVVEKSIVVLLLLVTLNITYPLLI